MDETIFKGEVISKGERYDVQIGGNYFLTDLIHYLEGKQVKITIEIIE